MDDLLKDAIADAKAVRETALANAKIALEEAFTPRIQSMLSQKIQQETEGEEEVPGEEVPVEQEEPEAEEEPEIAAEPEIGEEPIVAQDEVPGDEEPLVAQDEVPGEDEPVAVAEPEDVLAAQDEVPGDEWSEEEPVPEEEPIEGVIEINGVKYAPVVSEEDEEEAENPFAEGEGEEATEDELDLEAILKELEDEADEAEVDENYEEGEVGDGLSSKEATTADEAELAENDVSSDIGDADNKVADAAADSSDVGQGSEEPAAADAPAAGHENSEDEEVDDLVEVNGVRYQKVKEQDEWEARNGDLEKNEGEDGEDIDLEEILRALSEQDEEEEEKAEEQVSKLSSELGEHRKVVKYLRGKLNEVNLLNAKLLFTNKLFRAHGLTNEQKLKVVETFDRATNLREVKLVFATLAESFGSKPASTVKQIKEKKGSASKAVASTKPKSKKVIGEGFDMKDRFQKLANIL
jgi:pilus assembly protein FimV